MKPAGRTTAGRRQGRTTTFFAFAILYMSVFVTIYDPLSSFGRLAWLPPNLRGSATVSRDFDQWNIATRGAPNRVAPALGDRCGGQYRRIDPKHMNRISEYRNHAAQCVRLAESSNERDRRALLQMAADWHALADKARQREANSQEQEAAPVLTSPISPEPTEPPLKPKHFRPKSFQKRAPTSVLTAFLRSK